MYSCFPVQRNISEIRAYNYIQLTIQLVQFYRYSQRQGSTSTVQRTTKQNFLLTTLHHKIPTRLCEINIERANFRVIGRANHFVDGYFSKVGMYFKCKRFINWFEILIYIYTMSSKMYGKFKCTITCCSFISVNYINHC